MLDLLGYFKCEHLLFFVSRLGRSVTMELELAPDLRRLLSCHSTSNEFDTTNKALFNGEKYEERAIARCD